ncbi:MAG: hypothetical protein NVS9B14_03320 [Candidatus Acidiferrum sp.]
MCVAGPSDATPPDRYGWCPSAFTEAGKREYKISLRFPVTAPGGSYHVSRLDFFDGMSVVHLKLPNLALGELRIKVIPRMDLVEPTSADISITPSQAQLLRKAAVEVQGRFQTLKEALISMQSKPTHSEIAHLLVLRVREEMNFLAITEKKFRELSVSKTQLEPTEIFFEDLRTSYQEIESEINKIGRRAGSDITVSLARFPQEPSARSQASVYPVLAQAAFRVFEQNELAYRVVADAGSLTFDLEVLSVPEGAAIAYRRRGDTYRDHPNATNFIIKALPYAIWTVRFGKPGYREIEREHDPFREPNHLLNVQLERQQP